VPLATELGLDGARLCAEHGLSAETLDDPRARVPLSATLDILEELLKRSAHPSLGLLMARTNEPDAYHTPALILLASDCLRAGLSRAFRYQRLWGDGDRFALVDASALARPERGAAVSFRLPVARRPAVAVLEVCALAETMAGVRTLTGREHEPALALSLPETRDDLDSLSDYFRVRPELGGETAFVLFGEEVLEQPLPNANALFLSIFEHQAKSELARLPARNDWVDTVRAHVTRSLSQGEFSLARVARALGMTGRTLERRLAAQGTTYQELVDSVRRDLARRFLAEQRPVEEVSLLLGYSERSAFHRACRRWFQQTPAELRSRPITS
jgi:AraC-like DNA-binding protein